MPTVLRPDPIVEILNKLRRADDFVRAGRLLCQLRATEMAKVPALADCWNDFDHEMKVPPPINGKPFYGRAFMAFYQSLGKMPGYSDRFEPVRWERPPVVKLARRPRYCQQFVAGAMFCEWRKWLKNSTAAPAKPLSTKPTCSPDFTSVDWFGTRYTFAKGNQAESVRALWEAWANGGHSLTKETIGDRIGSTASRFDLAKVFRRKAAAGGYEPHPAWGTMIRPDSKGSYRLTPPESA